MRIVAVCGAGIGTSAILKVNAERALERLGIEADVVASDLAASPPPPPTRRSSSPRPSSPRVRQAIGRRPSPRSSRSTNYFDVEEIGEKLEALARLSASQPVAGCTLAGSRSRRSSAGAGRASRLEGGDGGGCRGAALARRCPRSPTASM